MLKQLGETLTELKGELGARGPGGRPCCTPPLPPPYPSTALSAAHSPTPLSCSPLSSLLPVPSAHFPGLQSKMRVVLRVEVEAVKFLKEEPQRLDGLLKRCRGVTDTLAQIRRSFYPWPLTPDP